MNTQSSQRSKESARQRGSVLVIIFVAISLFAALGFVVTDMMGQGSPERISEERAKLLAGEIMDYSRSIRQAIQTMRISNGCTDTDISFTQTAGDAYEHTPQAAVECQVFHLSGGGRNYVKPTEHWLDKKAAAKSAYGEWFFDGRHCIDNVSSTIDPCVDANNELLMILPHIKKNICVAINNTQGVTNPSGDPPTENHDNHNFPFIGVYTAGANSLIDTVELSAKNSGCFRDFTGPWQDSYIYYQVLKAR